MRTKQTSISAAIGLLLLGSPVVADDTCKLGGMWRLVSFHSEDVVTKARVNIYGERPWGYLTIQCDGRFYAWAANAERRPVQSVWEDVAQSISELAAPRRAIYYSGIYSLTDDNMVIRVAVVHPGTRNFTLVRVHNRRPVACSRAFQRKEMYSVEIPTRYGVPVTIFRAADKD